MFISGYKRVSKSHYVESFQFFHLALSMSTQYDQYKCEQYHFVFYFT